MKTQSADVVAITNLQLISDPQRSEGTAFPVDLNGFREAAGGDRQETIDLLSLYAEQLEIKMRDLKGAFETGSCVGIKQAAHSLAGASSTCGLNEFSKSLRDIEQCGINGQIESAREIFLPICNEAERIAAAIKNELKAP